MTRTPEPMAAVDAFWLRADEPTNPMVINGVIHLGGPVDFEHLRSALGAALARYPRFVQTVEDPHGRPVWVDAGFDVGRHFERMPLPAPGDSQALFDLVGRIVSRPLELDRPLWRMVLVEGGADGPVLVVRIHHCIADGIALVHVLLTAAGAEPAGAVVPAPAPGALERIRRVLRHTEERVHEGWSFLRHLGPAEVAHRGADISAAVGKLLTMSSQDHPAFKGRLGVVKRVAWSEPLALARVKAVGAAFGGKVNDVLTALTAGALRRYLAERGLPVEDEILRVTVPVNLRPLDQAHQLGNRFGLVFLHLPVHLASPLERLRAVKAEMDALKGGAEAVVVFGLLNAIGRAPPGVERQMVDLFALKTSAVLTNVPGPQAPLTFAGYPIRNVMFWVPQTGSVSMGLSVISYAGHVQLGVTADAGLVPDPGRIVEATEAELASLESAVGAN